MTDADRIRRAWQASRMTQREFSGRLGVSITTLRSWMRPANNRSSRNPRPLYVREAERIAKAHNPMDAPRLMREAGDAYRQALKRRD